MDISLYEWLPQEHRGHMDISLYERLPRGHRGHMDISLYKRLPGDIGDIWTSHCTNTSLWTQKSRADIGKRSKLREAEPSYGSGAEHGHSAIS